MNTTIDPIALKISSERAVMLRQEELRNALIPARQRLEAATDAAFAQLDILLEHLHDPQASDQTCADAVRCLAARRHERAAAKAEVARLNRELGR